MHHIGLAPSVALRPASGRISAEAHTDPILLQAGGEISEIATDSPPLLAAMDLTIKADMKRSHRCHAN